MRGSYLIASGQKENYNVNLDFTFTCYIKLSALLADKNILQNNQEEIIWESDQQHVF